MRASDSAPRSALSGLIALLDLAPLGEDVYEGVSPQIGWSRVYGGLVIAQALVAAMRSVARERPVHSLHAYFLLPGNPAEPIRYEVERIRDGQSFATRRVLARQNASVIFVLSASFHASEAGFHHQLPMPAVPEPTSLPDEAALRSSFLSLLPPERRALWERPRPITMIPADPARYFDRKPGAPIQNVWFRANGPLPEDPTLHAAILAYASDMTLLDCALVAHGKSVIDADIMPASLDHALWFHEPFRADQWLLYAQDSPWSGHARGLGRGLIYTPEGRLVASVVQEGLIRPRRTQTE